MSVKRIPVKLMKFQYHNTMAHWACQTVQFCLKSLLCISETSP